MTTTVALGNRTDLRPASRLLAAIILPVGPAALALLRFLLPYSTTDDATAIESKVRAAPDRMSLVLWFGLIGFFTLVPAAFAVGRMTRRRAPRLTAAALLLLVPGYLAIGWLIAGDLLVWTGVHCGADPQLIVRMYEGMHPTIGIAEAVFVAGHVIGTILLGLALWRSQVVPRWAAVLVLVSQPLHFVAAVVLASHPLDLVAWGLQAVGFAAVSVAVLRLRDDDWDLPPVQGGAR